MTGVFDDRVVVDGEKLRRWFLLATRMGTLTSGCCEPEVLADGWLGRNFRGRSSSRGCVGLLVQFYRRANGAWLWSM